MTFGTDDLPADLDDEQRFALWRAFYADLYCAYDQYRPSHHNFSAHFTSAQCGDAIVGRFDGALERCERTRRHLAHDPSHLLSLSFNRSKGVIRSVQGARTMDLAPGAATLITTSETGRFEAQADFDWMSVAVPHKTLAALVADPEDLLLRPLDPQTPAQLYLSRYLGFVLAAPDIDASLDSHVETTLLDLVALALGARRDVADLARTRGLRAARRQAIIAEIMKRFTDPGFSSEHAAQALGMSRRYVNDLLAETGTGFAERVLEQRLQRARDMLTSGRHDHLRIGDIALACGFNEVSYFNRCFRRRFGLSPTASRGSA
ncbi:MAG: helix-turn-helix transcriptional regulator [Pseudomonadota bacterium]